MLNTEILHFIREHRLCVLAVEMPDGSPHSALVHFAHQENPLKFIVQTDSGSRKAERIRLGHDTRVSLVIGLDEKPDAHDTTFQVDGIARLTQTDGELSRIYLSKFIENTGERVDDIYVSVEPVWWRYSAWYGPEREPLIIESS